MKPFRAAYNKRKKFHFCTEKCLAQVKLRTN